MKKIILHIVLIVGFFSLGISSFAQSKDFGLWTGLAVEKQLHKDLDVEIEQQFRFSENITDFDRMLTEVGLSYKPFKFYRLGLSYRFVFKEAGDFGNRINFINTFRYKIEDFTLQYRINYQRYFAQNEQADNALRNKISLEYKINKHLLTFVAGELFYNFNYKVNHFNEYRLSAGLKHNLNKRHRLGYVFIFNQGFNVENPSSDFIVKINYKYTFKNKKKD